MVRTSATAALACALTLAVGACSAGPAEPSEDDRPDALATWSAQDAEGGDGAVLVGTLELAGGCLVVRTEVPLEADPSQPMEVTPVFPWPEVEWDGQTLRVQGMSVTVGERIELGGGLGSVPLREDERVEIPENCPAEQFFYVGA
ncbi:hypothetical protein EXU48_23525 [Occultella glacieicola]|uniref:Lipoprotein n=1 Tax=Occultella glacieicola TaxID=2518684 RepID=A0ABY2DWV0_9MICO|nr:hypothetical protein [Occultella glacieicola]TDE88347.1 hypothetical protein EXU48_23525 [Occultella glacieicola]